MGKLVCDFNECEKIKNEIKLFINDYDLILKSLINLETDLSNVWVSSAQKAYYNKFIERKKDLEQLSEYYSSLIYFLEENFKAYQNIENKYS